MIRMYDESIFFVIYLNRALVYQISQLILL